MNITVYRLTMKNLPPWTCVCCGFQTNKKYNMQIHLYNRKKPCPKCENNIELTEEIKDHIIKNRVYVIPSSQNVVLQTINYNNTINNFIAGLDTIEKLTKLHQYHQVETIDFKDSMEERYHNRAKLLEDGKRNNMHISTEAIVEFIDEVTKPSPTDLKDLNILYDSKYDKLHLYDSGEWRDFLVQKGVKSIIISLQEAILDSYECYLIRKSSNDLFYNKMCEHVQEYYAFIACFDVPPFVQDHSESEILNDKYDVEYDIQEKFLKIYKETKNSLTLKLINEYTKQVVDIIKTNTKKNIDDLNKKVVNLFHMDEDFKKSFGANNYVR